MSNNTVKWEEIHVNKEWGSYPNEELIRFMAKNYYNTVRKDIKVLDVGCGTGSNTWYLAKEGFDVYGFDASSTAINKCNMKIKSENLEVKLSIMDAASLKYNDSFFDVVVDIGLITVNKVEDIKKILKELYRVLNKGGKCFATMLFNKRMIECNSYFKENQEVEKNTFNNITKGKLSNIGIIHFFDKNELLELFGESGFSNFKIDTIERTINNGEEIISYFVVEAQK